MGILDELKKEAEKKQEETRINEARLKRLEENYQQTLLPKMQKTYNYFRELIDYLELIETPIAIEEYSAQYPAFGKLYQQDYRLSSDKHGGRSNFEKLREIHLRFVCRADGEFTYKVRTQHEIERETAFFHDHRVPFTWKRKTEEGSNKPFAIFTISKTIPVHIKFEVDYENSIIQLIIRNHENFMTHEYRLSAEEINDEFLDKLARYILRKDLSFIQMDIEDFQKELLQIQLESDKLQREFELKHAEKQEEMNSKQQGKNNLMDHFKRFLGK